MGAQDQRENAVLKHDLMILLAGLVIMGLPRICHLFGSRLLGDCFQTVFTVIHLHVSLYGTLAQTFLSRDFLAGRAF